MNNNLWICGQIFSEDGHTWDFQGVFSTEEKAKAACKNDSYFIGPVVLDEEISEETIEWEGCYYPLYEETKK